MQQLQQAATRGSRLGDRDTNAMAQQIQELQDQLARANRELQSARLGASGRNVAADVDDGIFEPMETGMITCCWQLTKSAGFCATFICFPLGCLTLDRFSGAGLSW
eukprot:SAG31_NODE_4763_length_2973_cov_1.655532_2_plen_106_part_00